MKYLRILWILGLLLGVASGVWGQSMDTIPKEHILTLNRIAGEYDFWKMVFSITAVILAIWNFVGLKFFVKMKAEEWVLSKIAKEADLKVEHVKSAVHEFARIAHLKKKKITVISENIGQQNNVKKVFDGCGFSSFEWKSIADLPGLVLQNTDLILLNDQPDHPLIRVDIESVFEKFKTNVAYQYFGPKNDLPIGEYRKKHPNINLGLCNSADRLETGLISLLKII